MHTKPLNIVDIIEKNPITKLSNTYNNKLLTKIKEIFTEKEQQLFISSFYLYLNCNKDEFVVSVDDIWGWLGFNQKEALKRLLIKCFIENLDYSFRRSAESKKEGRGGSTKEIIMLTVKCFKLLCIKAGTKKANEIHEYFIKLEEMLQDIILEECDEVKLQLENKNDEVKLQLENKDKEYEVKLKKEKQLERQEILLREYGSIGSIVYIIKVKSYDDGKYVIKIGESRIGITERYTEHKSNYQEILLLDCFMVQKSKEFESFLHNHRDIRPSKVRNLEGHEKENELFLIGDKLTYQNILNIISYNIKNYNYTSQNDVELNKINNENLKIIKDISENENFMNLTQDLFIKLTNELTEQYKNLLNEINELKQSNKTILENQNTLSQKTITNFNQPLATLGPRLQKINPETLLLVKMYESVSELMKEDIKYKRPSINKAIINNTIYHGFRWTYVDRDLDSSIVNITPTKEVRLQNLGYIAKINKDKTEIFNVYLDRKTASKYNYCKSQATLDNIVKNGKIYNGYYYMLYDNCEKCLKEKFENKYGVPVLYKNGVGQYDCNNNLINEFECKLYCSKILKIGDKSLTKALNNNIMYNNCYYKYLGNKYKMV